MSQLISTTKMYTNFRVFLKSLYQEDNSLLSKNVATTNNTDIYLSVCRYFILLSYEWHNGMINLKMLASILFL
jgi:hypothetical protein